MTFTPAPETNATHGWRREGFTVALIGPEAMQHRELLIRAGYTVRGAKRGDQAAQLFGDPEPVDVIVLDFALQGRPPEAILLFSRRTSAAAQLIALVPAQDADAFRRAFLAGARDVLPSPARGEDLLAAVDLLLEPRALATLVERLRTHYGVDDETQALPPAPGPGGGVPPERLAQLESEVTHLHQELRGQRTRQEEELARLRQQALDAVEDRDRILESRNEARERLASSRKEQRESAAQLRMMERACEELQRKLKDARDQRRGLEARLGDAQKRTEALEQAMRTYVSEAEREVQLDMEFAELSSSPSGLEVDPEEALQDREHDERRLAELEEALEERSRLAARVVELEAQLKAGGQDTGEVKELSDLEDALSRRAEDEERLAELDDVLEKRRFIEDQVEQLRRDLGKGDGSAIARDLEELREAYDQTLTILEAVRTDRDNLKRRLADLEREAADALMRIEELSPLVVEVEQLHAELRAERDAARTAKRTAGRAQTRFTQLGRASAAMEDELIAAQRSSVLGRARADVLQAELKNARAALTAAHAARTETLQRLREAELELDSLRVTVAALSADRRAQRSSR